MHVTKKMSYRDYNPFLARTLNGLVHDSPHNSQIQEIHETSKIWEISMEIIFLHLSGISRRIIF